LVLELHNKLVLVQAHSKLEQELVHSMVLVLVQQHRNHHSSELELRS
jgi:hypothetical protein